MTHLKHNIYLKIGIIIFLVIILMLPTALIKGLIRERQGLQAEALTEVSNKWGREQTITGPVLTIPYDRFVKHKDKEGNVTKIDRYKEFLHFMPDQLNIDGALNPERLHRGIHEIVVYDSDLKLNGSFTNIDLEQFDIPTENIHLDKAFVTLGITDLRGIEEQVWLHWNGKKKLFKPGIADNGLIKRGIHASVVIDSTTNKNFKFSIPLDIKGSRNIQFAPVGKSTVVKLNSKWSSPSFGGEFLPDHRSVSKDGFTAEWKILNLNRSFPQSWRGKRYSVNESHFGVELLLPVDNYRKNMRVAKYGLLIITFTFLVFFFIEILNKVFIHPIQYCLVGLALVIFFTLLLSISEHFTFNRAYMIATIATVGLVASYIRSILRSWPLAFLTGVLILLQYGFVYTLIQLEDYSLLMGSVGIFAILALVMYLSRKIDWYEIKLGGTAEKIDS